MKPEMPASVVEEWETVQVPGSPELSSVTVHPEKTALLVLDLQTRNCNLERRPRCVATLPKVRSLLERARASGMLVVYTLTRGADRSDIRDEVAPLTGELSVDSGVDKFYGTKLHEILASKNIQALVLVGTSAHGAVLHTATAAAMRDFHVVVPVDCISADDPYAEQYTVWHVANSPGTRRHAVLTRSDTIAMG